MFSGGAGWAEIQRRCLCVGASVKHNKTLWGMNQTQTDRDTKAHMLIHSVNFTISPPLSPSLFFTLAIFLSFFLVNWPLHYCLVRPAYHYVFWLRRAFQFLDSCQVYCVGQVLCQTRTNRTRSPFLYGYHCVCVRARANTRTSHPSWHEWASKSYSLPLLFSLLYLIFSASLIPSLPLSSSRVLLGEQSYRECHNRGINQMYIELAWLTQSMWCFYLPNTMWIGPPLPEKCLFEHPEQGGPFTASRDPGPRFLRRPHLGAHSSSFS